MKAFTERNPKRIGLVAIVVMVAIVAAVLLLNRSLFSSTYPGQGTRYPDRGRDRRRDAGGGGRRARSGSSDRVAIDGNAVVAILDINHGVVLPRHTSAAVQVETLLGVEDVALQPVGG